MNLIFEESRAGRRCAALPALDVPAAELPARRGAPLELPEVSEVQLVRHYTNLSRMAFGVDNGFYPLGSCTMKYNPKLNEDAAALPGFTDIHPLQPEAGGCEAVMAQTVDCLKEITGMDAFTLQPCAGAHGEFTALSMIAAYFMHIGEARSTVIVPDSAHGTNPASAAMAGFKVVTVKSTAPGLVDVAALKSLLTADAAAIMLTNPNTLGLFETDILEITRLAHENGSLVYYDGANLNAVMGIARPGDMGFDVVHLNLHKTFATPHGGGGPGSGPVGCKAALAPFLPGGGLSIGRVSRFNGNFLVIVRALTYLLALGGDGLKAASETAVLNAGYMLSKLSGVYDAPYKPCMHEFVLSLECLKAQTGVSAGDIAKSLIDAGFHPPTMYFPLIVHEALMFEPTETETPETLEAAANVLLELYRKAQADPAALRAAPATTPISRPDEVKAARSPVIKA